MICLCIVIFFSCQNDSSQKKQVQENKNDYSIQSPLGKKLTPSEPSKEMLGKFEKAKQDFSKNPKDVDNIIWYGRRTAYLGRYEDAIKIYSDGISQFPNDARLYRHRGHRFISIRKYDEAIKDF